MEHTDKQVDIQCIGKQLRMNFLEMVYEENTLCVFAKKVFFNICSTH